VDKAHQHGLFVGIDIGNQQDQQQELPFWVKSKAAGIVTSYPLVI
jgi:hypothetical protein